MKMNYFPEPHTNKNKLDVELYFSNYAKKSDGKNSTGDDTSQFAKKIDLANLKSDVYKLDIVKLKTVPIDLSKLSNVVNKNVFKRDVYNTKGLDKKIEYAEKDIMLANCTSNKNIREVENKTWMLVS